MTCPLCGQPDLHTIYRTGPLPVFQNKVHRTRSAARAAATGSVELRACGNCGFVFNGAFDVALMQYDAEYQNEQAHSPAFDRYLDGIVDMLEQRGFRGSKVAEVGCGKGAFLDKLWRRGFDAIGFDTAYEGNDPRVFKEYFSETHAHMTIDLVILRHTLEHIEQPFAFLRTLAGLVKPRTSIYIEVPSFEWIVGKKAFWDIFYEHCNYFTLQSLNAMFKHADSGLLFGDQYMYVLAEMGSLRERAAAVSPVALDELNSLQAEIDVYAEFTKRHAGLVVWGAGAKGSTFVNIVDPEMKYVRSVVDMNTKKAGGFIAKSGHQIISPRELASLDGKDILVMNENYLKEIRQMLEGLGQTGWQLHTLGLLDRS